MRQAKRPASHQETQEFDTSPSRGFDYAAPKTEAKMAVSSLKISQSWLGQGIKEPNLPSSIIAGSFIINICALASPLVILQVYDRIIPNQAKSTLLMLMLFAGGCLILDVILKSLRSYSLGYMSSKYMHHMQVEAMQRMMYAKSGATENTALSTHMNRFTALGQVADFHGGQSRTTAIDMPFVLIFLGLMALVGGAIALVPLALFALFAVVSLSFNKVMNSELNKRMQFDNRKYDFIIETLSGIFTIKALGLESAMQRRYERLQQNSAEGTHKTVHTGNMIQDFSVVFGSVAQIFVVAYGAVMVIDGQMSQGALACCTLLSGQVLSPLLRGVSIYSEYQNLALRRNEANHLFDYPHISQAAHDYDIQGQVTFENVSLHNDGSVAVNISNITAQFNRGEIIGIHASHDQATTALLRMVKGDLAPQQGRVLIDGKDLYAFETSEGNHALSKQIVYVSDKSQLFRGTILENLTLFEMSKRRHAAFEAARIMGIEEEISQLPEGYDTKVGEGASFEFGADFSNRLCIARGLVALPQVLILDHIGDNFDVNGIIQLRKTLDAVRGRFTVILTSNDSRLLKVADKVFALRDGQLYQAKMSAGANQAPVAPQTQASAQAPMPQTPQAMQEAVAALAAQMPERKVA